MTVPFAPDALSKDKIDRLSVPMGLALPHQEQWDFLQSMHSMDLQAAPGSGKTSLVGLKLALLADSWESTTRGVCVLSHTNTAKDEIITRLSSVPEGRRLLGYPHFIGTIQAFTNTFFALPALRARGIDVRSIDNDAYEEAALWHFDRNPAYRTLRSSLSRRMNGRELVAQATYVCEAGSLRAQATQRLPFKDDSPSGKQYAELKYRLTKQGIFRYHDMFAIAEIHLAHHPQLAQAAAHRFPFVLLDEMQDTAAYQQRLLAALFPPGAAVVQRVGDVNQRIYTEPGGSKDPGYPFPFPHSLASQLPVSRRLGRDIADFASALTLQRPQDIIGAGPQGTLALLLFSESNYQRVVPAFERLAAALVPEGLLKARPPRVLAARTSRGGAQAVPQSLQCYLPDYVRPKAAGPALLIDVVRQAQEDLAVGDGHSAGTAVWNALRGLIRDRSREPLPTLRLLDRQGGTPDAQVRSVLRDLLFTPVDDPARWEALTDRTRAALLRLAHEPGRTPALSDESFVFRPSPLAASRDATSHAREAGYTHTPALAGTIQAAKGETHCASLILDCLESTGQKFDVHEVLSRWAAGDPLTQALPTIKKAAQLVFVGATRPTHLLAFATHRERAEPYVDTLYQRGWTIHDVV
ncbi:UvrD-helicase domain-containing protein [Streptomyces sp. NPDC008079]|uniref:UvrD-helicase domain-containing protein n=1 Tax=Streptomyces sp. NPDC008079 TaxID=3364806 RepID=UPI0036F11F5F